MLEPTVEFAEDGAALRPIQPQMPQIGGSDPRLADDTARILRGRLAGIAGATSIVMGLYTLRQIFYPVIEGAGSPPVAAMLTAILVLYPTVFCLLVSNRIRWTLWQLRVVELGCFFGMSAYAAVRQIYGSVDSLEAGKPIVAAMASVVPLSYWCMIIFSYALYIPASWQRTSSVVLAMAITPIIITAMLERSEGLGPILPNGTTPMAAQIMLCTALLAIVGAYLINAMRAEGFAAKQLGQYQLQRLLGAGGMGEVYLGEHVLLKRPCAVKLISPSRVNDPQALARFEREVRATAELSHFNKVEIYDYGSTEDGTFYYVMEYLPGSSLQELVERTGPMPAARVIYFLQQVCGALEEAHAAGLVHRDIKPSNIMAANRGGQPDVAKLLDFGLVKSSSTAANISKTQEGTLHGSPLYMSPEQALGTGEPDARSDIYSLGAVAYFLLTGQPPFQGQTAMEVLVAHARDLPRRVCDLQPSVPDDLAQLIESALAKAPADRLQTAASFRRALSNCRNANDWNTDKARNWWAAHRALATDLRTAVAH